MVDRIRELLSGPRTRALRSKELARSLAVPTEDYREFRQALRDLVRKGTLERVKGNRYALPGPPPAGESVTGTGREGVAPVDGSKKPDRDKRPEKTRLVGIYQRGRGGGTVTPLDPRVKGRIHVPLGKEGGAVGGDVVVLLPLRRGSGARAASAEVESVLGHQSEPGVDVLAVLHAYGLPEAFPPAVEAAAAEAAQRMESPGERVDLRSLHVFTIDPSDAKDHDDALSVIRVEPNLLEVGIHIADVAHFVTEGSPLDREAFLRGTSVYLVDQVVPMLPHALSSGLCSLREGEDRLALSVILRMDGEGNVRAHRFERTWIRCRRRLSYDDAQDVLTERAATDPLTDEALRTLDRLAKALRARRRARGSLDFDLPEARVVLDAEGMPIDIRKIEQLDSHRLIEDFMILANELVARSAESRGLHITFRVHESPAPDRAEALREFLQPLGYSLPRGKPGPDAYQRVLDRAEGRPEQGLVSTVVLRSMARARYDAENQGHFGLASESYAHFTSPIRRYPDLALHRVVGRCLIDGEPPHRHWTHAFMSDVAETSSNRERVAQQAERDSIEMKKVEFMSRHLGDEFAGTISGVTSFGLFVLLDRYFVEGLIHVSSLGDDYYLFLAEEYALAGQRSKRRFQLGDRVQVQVVRTDKEGRRIDFLLVDNPSVSKPRKPSPKRPNSRGGKRRKRV